jgi:predicted DNA-binding transcriptional regulator YafY
MSNPARRDGGVVGNDLRRPQSGSCQNLRQPRGFCARIQEAFLAQRALRIAYRDGSGATSARKVEPHYLLFNPPCWYLLAWDSGKDAARHFRLDRLTDAGVAEEPFTLRPSKQLMPDVDTFFDGL